MYNFRNEKALVSIEKKQSIVKRWNDGNQTFMAAKDSLLGKKKESIKLQMQKLASERLFHLEMKKKYAGKQNKTKYQA